MDEVIRRAIACEVCGEERLLDVEPLPEGRTGVVCQVCGRVTLLDANHRPIHV